MNTRTSSLRKEEFPKNGTLREQQLFVLRYAVRAPSTHNTQPWLFRLEGATISVFPDMGKRLPEADKDGRNIGISIGACVEHIVGALKFYGMFEHLELRDTLAEGVPMAIVTCHSSVGIDDDFAQIISAMNERFNARGPFLQKPIAEETLRLFSRVAIEGVALNVFLSEKEKQIFADLTARGMLHVHAQEKFRAELSRWMISNYSKKCEGIPGYSMLAPGVLSLVLPWIIRTFNMGALLALLNKKSILSAHGFGVISTTEDSPIAWVKTGMLFERLSLTLNTSGIFTSIFVASIESSELRAELREKYVIRDLPQFAFAFGFPKIILPQSPRHAPEERMI